MATSGKAGQPNLGQRAKPVFNGTFQHSMDAKGRTSLPAKFREQLAAEGASHVVLTKGPEHTLWGYAPAEWAKLLGRLAELSPFSKELRAWRHAVVLPAQECPFDKLGRVLVPPLLREYAKLESDVVWGGNADHLELWNAEAIRKRDEEVEPAFEFDPFAALEKA